VQCSQPPERFVWMTIGAILAQETLWIAISFFLYGRTSALSGGGT
jgi:hypothetical protein